MKWLLAVLLFFGASARAEQLELAGIRIFYPAGLETEALEAATAWQAAQTIMLEVGSQKLANVVCLAALGCSGTQLMTEPTAPNGLRAVVAWLLETAARPPPAWFLTGIIKRQAGLQNSNTRAEARRRAWLLAGQFPSLIEINLSISASMLPRAEFGEAFAEYLIERFGLVKLKNILKFYYANWSLSDAFAEVLHTPLELLFADWRNLEQQRTQKLVQELEATGLPLGESVAQNLDAFVWLSGSEFLAVQGTGLYHGQLGQSPVLVQRLPFAPNRLSLAKDGAIIYTRPRAYGGISGEVFRFLKGQEQQLTIGANATDAVADGDCAVYIKAASSLWRWCKGETKLLWTAPKNWRVEQVATRSGKIALRVVRSTYSDIAILKGGSLEFATSDLANDQNPVWLDDQTLIFSSDRRGASDLATIQLWRLRLGESQVVQISAAVGGAFSANLLPNQNLSYSSFVGLGSEIRLLSIQSAIHLLSLQKGLCKSLEFSDPPAPRNLVVNPSSLQPDIGIGFTSGIGLEAQGNDGVLAYRVAAGYDFFGSAGLGADLTLRFAPIEGWRFNLNGNINQAKGYSLLARVSWFGIGEVLTERVGVVFSPFLTLENGLLIGWFDFSLGVGLSDAWGYSLRNWSVSSRINSQARYGLSFSLTDQIAESFLEATLGASGLWNQSPLLSARLGIRNTWTAAWRLGDGVLSFERLTVQVFGLLSTREMACGLQILLDGVLNYNAIFTLGLELNYSSRSAWVVGIVWR